MSVFTDTSQRVFRSLVLLSIFVVQKACWSELIDKEPGIQYSLFSTDIGDIEIEMDTKGARHKSSIIFRFSARLIRAFDDSLRVELFASSFIV